MAEMLSDNMKVEHWRALAESEGSPSPRNMGQREVPDMLSWLHCFSLYAAIVCSYRPDRARQMWAYQALMITEACRPSNSWGWPWIVEGTFLPCVIWEHTVRTGLSPIPIHKECCGIKSRKISIDS